MKATLTADGNLLFWCPGCEEHHGIPVNGSRGWMWNGSVDSPTVNPSILVRSGPGMANVCHSFVVDGKIVFLDDCTHALAGQGVELPEVDQL